MEKNNQIFWFFTVAVISLLTLPTLLQNGMFMDGLIYASVSHNLANGYGTWNELHFSETFMNPYCEQLPLFFWVEAFVFKVLGNSIYSERIFALLCCILTIVNIRGIWKNLSISGEKYLAWLPVFFFGITPIVFWAFSNHVQEVFMVALATSSVFFQLKGINSGKLKFFLIGGLFLFLTSFCKGFQGLFPIVFIPIWWLFQKDTSFSKATLRTFLVGIVPLFILAVLWFIPYTKVILVNFYENRIVRTFSNAGSATTDNRLELIFRLIQELLPMLVLGGVWMVGRRFKGSKIDANKKMAFIFILLGVSGSLPLIVTLEQRGFYLVTSIPFYVIGFSILIRNSLYQAISELEEKKTLSIVSKVFMVIGIITPLFFVGTFKKDEKKISDVQLISSHVNGPEIVDVPTSLRMDYSTTAYFVRFGHISLSETKKPETMFYIQEIGKGDVKGYEKIELKTQYIELFQRVSF